MIFPHKKTLIYPSHLKADFVVCWRYHQQFTLQKDTCIVSTCFYIDYILCTWSGFAEIGFIVMRLSPPRLKEEIKTSEQKVNNLTVDLRRKDDDSSDLREKVCDSKKQIQQVQKEVRICSAWHFIFGAETCHIAMSLAVLTFMWSHSDLLNARCWEIFKTEAQWYGKA